MINTKKIADGIYEVEKQGEMKVPLGIFASDSILSHLQKDRAIEQGMNMATLPGIVKNSIMMADAHQGYGFPIGGVAAMDFEKGCISPGGIGFDINCGVRLLKTPLKKADVQDKMDELLSAIYENVPVGVGGESKIPLEFSDIEEILEKGVGWALEKGYANDKDVENCEEKGCMSSADPSKITQRAKARGRKQLGTLGAGNHFIEVQAVEDIFDSTTAEAFGLSGEQVVVLIHCGSRGLGHQVCSDYIRAMEEDDPDLMSSLVEKDLIYARSGTKLFNDYLGAMSAAANFAWTNRQLIMHNIRESFVSVFGCAYDSMELLYDVSHNIAKIENHVVDGKKMKLLVHRKGATRAFSKERDEVLEQFKTTGQPVLIPGSMGTKSYVLVGTEEAMKLSFGSTAHGAGRMMSRNQAKKEFTAENVKKGLEDSGIKIKSRSMKGITEEAPGVYKDVDDVVKVSDTTGIGKLVASLKPLGVIKG